VRISLPKIEHSLTGFEAVVQLHEMTKDCLFDDIQIDMKQATC